MPDQIMLYIRENIEMTAIAAGGAIALLLLFTLFQVTRTRREVHKICKKIRKYFDVVLSEEEKEPEAAEEIAEDEQIPVYQTSDEWQKQQTKQKNAEDAQLLMEVISEIF